MAGPSGSGLELDDRVKRDGADPQNKYQVYQLNDGLSD